MSTTTISQQGEYYQQGTPSPSKTLLLKAFYPAPFRLLDLPYEVRLLVYEFVFLIDPDKTLSHTGHPPRLHQERRLPSLAVLYTCSHVYQEARALCLRANTFDFYRWYSSNVFECRQFLRKLQPWQVPEIRSIRLAITEADLKQSEADDPLRDVCQSVGPYLQSLDLEISVMFDVTFDWQAASVGWISTLRNMQRLRSLSITLGRRISACPDDITALQVALGETLLSCRHIAVASRKIEEDRRTQAEGNTYIEVHQTVITVPNLVC